ncbi:HNH endonuclease, partial [Mycobacterium sp. DSM 3803]|nr:HNH endonuclease [Mycobacterium sp. DSM 3803]
MDARYLDTVINGLIDELTPSPEPVDGADRRLCHLLDSPRRVVDDGPLLAVLAAAVTARNLFDYVIAQAVAAAERAGVPTRKRLRSGAQVLTALGVAPAAAYRAVRVGRAAHALPALTRQQRLGALGIELVDAVGKGVTHIDRRGELSDEARAQVVRTLMIQTTPAGVGKKAR